jgi:hypothetical protein
MELLTKIAWGLLALVHVAPAAVLLRPSLAEQLYGVSPTGEAGVLIIHRGALFLAIVALAIWAAFDEGARRAAGFAVAISVIGFLAVYWRAGAPAGALRTIAIADVVAIVPLAWVIYEAWKPAS